MTPHAPSPTALRIAFIAASIDTDPDVEGKLFDLQLSFRGDLPRPSQDQLPVDVGLALEHVRITMGIKESFSHSAFQFTDRLHANVLEGEIIGRQDRRTELAQSIAFLAAAIRHYPERTSKLHGLFKRIPCAYCEAQVLNLSTATALKHLENVLLLNNDSELMIHLDAFTANIRNGVIRPPVLNQYAMLLLTN